jgi:hypothetical protein
MIYQPGSFAFIHIPRTGGMAVRATIMRESSNFSRLAANQFAAESQTHPRTRRHTTWRELAAIYPDLPRIFTFCTIRDPFSWFESSFSQLMHWRDSVITNGRDAALANSKEWRTVLAMLGDGFAGYVQHHASLADDGGLAKYWAGDIDGRVAVTTVVRVEDLSRRWPELWHRMGPETPYEFHTPPAPELIRTNSVPRLAVQWTPQLISKVRSWCSYDFRTYYPQIQDPK